MNAPYDFWNQVVTDVLVEKKATIYKSDDIEFIPRPEESGLFVRSIGEPKGQIADWRSSIPGSRNRKVHSFQVKIDSLAIHLLFCPHCE